MELDSNYNSPDNVSIKSYSNLSTSLNLNISPNLNGISMNNNISPPTTPINMNGFYMNNSIGSMINNIGLKTPINFKTPTNLAITSSLMKNALLTGTHGNNSNGSSSSDNLVPKTKKSKSSTFTFKKSSPKNILASITEPLTPTGNRVSLSINTPLKLNNIIEEIYPKCIHINIINTLVFKKAYELVYKLYNSINNKSKLLEYTNFCIHCKDSNINNNIIANIPPMNKYLNDTNKTLMICLECSTFSCKKHIDYHNNESEHILFYDLGNNTPYCISCKSYIFNMQFKPVIIAPSFEIVNNHGYHGLRGLCNLGNTCYMNAILQPLFNTNFLHEYFFNEGHFNCKGDEMCFGCCFDAMFQDMYNNSCTPYNPHKFLHNAWVNLPQFASYEQHDAHEFLMAVFDLIHNTCKTESDCCLMHKNLSGMIRSDLNCNNCLKKSSFKLESIIDITLDIVGPNGPTITFIGKNNKKKVQYNNTDLISCLQRYTQKELLGTTEQMFCSECNINTDWNKQLSFEKLPNLIVFHLKRFEHGNLGSKLATKVDNFVQFPLNFSMFPYLNSTQLTVPTPEDNGDYNYSLYAIVEHLGQIDGGHYVCYIKKGKFWYKCDDGWIMTVHINMVLQCHAYLLFYEKIVKKNNKK